MRKKILLALTAVLAVVLFALSACSSFPALKGIDGEPNTDFAVLGNGTSAVMIDKYVYFVNGIEDLNDDENGNTNKWGGVVKGGLFRAELIDGKVKSTDATNSADFYNDRYRGYYGDYKVYTSTQTPASDDYLGLKLKTITDYAENDVLMVDSVQIVPKKISSGIYVFGDWIYYTSPNNLKSKQGDVRDDLTDFYRTRHNGKDTQLLYTTENAGTPKFGFYYKDGNVYLTVLDGTNLISVEAGEKKTKKSKVIAEDVTDAVFAIKPVFTKNTPSGQMEDFVYFTRAVTNDDALPTGNVLERIAPDGNDDTRFTLINNGFTITLNSIKTGYLYYTQADSVSTKMYAHSFKGFPKSTSDLSDDGKTVKAELGESAVATLILGDTTSYTNIYAGNQVVSYNTENGLSATHYIVAVKNESTVSIVYPSTVETVILQGVSANVSSVDGNDFYYQVGADGTVSGKLFKANLFNENQTPLDMTEDDVSYAEHIKVSAIEGYLFYVSAKNNVFTVEDTALETYKYTNNYMKVRRTIGSSAKEWEMYELKEEDIPAEDEETNEEESV